MTQPVERSAEMLAALISAVPFAAAETPRIVDIGLGDGRLAIGLLEAFPAASLTALEHGEDRRADASRLLERFGRRVRVAPFEIAGLDWWDVLFGADVVVSALAVNQLNDAKKQYLYKAVADRLGDRGALLIADQIQAPPLFHQLVWLRHAGFADVNCWWAFKGYAVFGGYKAPAGATR